MRTMDTNRQTAEPPGLVESEDEDRIAGLQSEGSLEAVEGFIPFRRLLLTYSPAIGRTVIITCLFA